MRSRPGRGCWSGPRVARSAGSGLGRRRGPLGPRPGDGTGRKIVVPACGGPNRRKGHGDDAALRAGRLPPQDRAGETPIRMTAVSALRNGPLHWMLLTTEDTAGTPPARCCAGTSCAGGSSASSSPEGRHPRTGSTRPTTCASASPSTPSPHSGSGTCPCWPARSRTTRPDGTSPGKTALRPRRPSWLQGPPGTAGHDSALRVLTAGLAGFHPSAAAWNSEALGGGQVPVQRRHRHTGHAELGRGLGRIENSVKCDGLIGPGRRGARRAVVGPMPRGSGIIWSRALAARQPTPCPDGRKPPILRARPARGPPLPSIPGAGRGSR